MQKNKKNKTKQKKTGIDTAKTASKRVAQKTTEASGDLTGNKIANKITSIDEIREIYIPPEKRNNLLRTLGCFEHKMKVPL